ncbi:MAG TPA: thermonuclease family protein [Geminicoccus sp.]|uniref:thermonuclease family protein n=1 Tax=Geminicoccus sp. TaxID=2024832 RepID=UPI002C6ABEE7|nr:thermonuclease family protein [Geminicoccus sp.]HWL70150.1 thermonuclease family protein [Geminicoccus sp.]
MLYPAELRARSAVLYHRCPVSASRRGTLALLAGLAGGAMAPVALGRAALTPVRADEWRLADGRLLRLASIVVPDRPDMLAAKALARARELAEESELVPSVLAQADRFGRLVGSLRDGRGHDLRAGLLREGLAVVRTGEEDDQALLHLLAEEAQARHAGRAIWGELDQAVATAEDVGRRIGRFVLVRARVVAHSRRFEADFLDFGPDWRTDFGIRIRKADLPAFIAAGRDPAALVGRVVEVRGWPFLASGPMLELRHPLELEPMP